LSIKEEPGLAPGSFAFSVRCDFRRSEADFSREILERSLFTQATRRAPKGGAWDAFS
jgi:hypothetical protein